MKQQNLVSVIIPCYNQARFLGQAIRSALDQTYPHLEVIVVDDGSQDQTPQVAASYPEVNYIRQDNRGPAAARNRGLAESRGEYVVFLDADDRLVNDAVSTGASYLDAHPHCAFVYGHIKLIEESGSPLLVPEQKVIERDHYVELLLHNHIWTTGAVMYRRKILDLAGGFNHSVNASADYDLNIRIARLFPILCHGKIILEYRKHSTNMTRNLRLMMKDSISVRRRHRKYVRGNVQHAAALERGIKSVQLDYGEKLIRAVKDQLRRMEIGEAFAGIVTLCRFYPQGLARRAGRKLFGKTRPEDDFAGFKKNSF